MANDFPIKDPQRIWQEQPTEPLRMSANVLRNRALERQSKARLEAHMSLVIGLVLGVFFAWAFTRAHTAMARIGWCLLSLWGFYVVYHTYKWVLPQNLPEDTPESNCLEFYRRELEKRRDHLRHRIWRLGLPILPLPMGMVIVGTGAGNAPPNAWRNAVPFFFLLAVWAVLFVVMRRKLGRENLQQEIEDLRRFTEENR